MDKFNSEEKVKILFFQYFVGQKALKFIQFWMKYKKVLKNNLLN